MPKITEICDLSKLNSLYNKMIEEENAIREKEWLELIKHHRETYIFNSYEEALDWCVKNPGKKISWHCIEIEWSSEESIFLSYEQEIIGDDAMFYNVIRKRTREEILSTLYEWMGEKGYNVNDLKDEYGKLNYVGIL